MDTAQKVVHTKRTLFLVHFRIDVQQSGEYEIVDESAFFQHLFHFRITRFLRLLNDTTNPTVQLHFSWLPVSYRIRFKLCCLVHAIHYGRSPAYLTETVQSVGASRSRSGLRSSSTSSMDYSLPRLRTKFG